MAKLNWSNTAVVTNITALLNDSATSFSVTDATGYPASDFKIWVDNEVMLVGSRTGTAFSSVTRGHDGTAAATHQNGAAVRHVTSAEDFQTSLLGFPVPSPLVGQDGFVVRYDHSNLEFDWVDPATLGSGTYLPLAGGTMSGEINMGTGQNIVGLVNLSQGAPASSTKIQFSGEDLVIYGGTGSDMVWDWDDSDDWSTFHKKTAFTDDIVGQSNRTQANITNGTWWYRQGIGMSSSDSAKTGTFAIKVPSSESNMMNIRVHIYNYTGTTSAVQMVLGGYTYVAGSYWVSTSASLLGMPDGSVDLTSVRFVNLLGTPDDWYILLGDSSTTWSYPKIMVESLQGHSGSVDSEFDIEFYEAGVNDEPTWDSEATVNTNANAWNYGLTIGAGHLTMDGNYIADVGTIDSRDQPLYINATNSTAAGQDLRLRADDSTGTLQERIFIDGDGNTLFYDNTGTARAQVKTTGLTIDGILDGPADPTAGTHVGDRDYNDARYAQGDLADYLPLDGTGTMTGDIDMGSPLGNDIINVGTVSSQGSLYLYGKGNGFSSSDVIINADDDSAISRTRIHVDGNGQVKLKDGTGFTKLAVDSAGVTLSGPLISPTDPTAGTHVGDRDYNDNRYENWPAVSTHASDVDAHHAKYLDAEAVSAMGVLGDSNPLNHSRYTDGEAAAKIASDDYYVQIAGDTMAGGLTIDAVDANVTLDGDTGSPSIKLRRTTMSGSDGVISRWENDFGFAIGSNIASTNPQLRINKDGHLYIYSGAEAGATLAQQWLASGNISFFKTDGSTTSLAWSGGNDRWEFSTAVDFADNPMTAVGDISSWNRTLQFFANNSGAAAQDIKFIADNAAGNPRDRIFVDGDGDTQLLDNNGAVRIAATTAGATITGVLSGVTDPTGGTHVGDRDYNDLRYADIASEHTRYLDSEAVTAMGVKGDSNALHHDRYTDGEATAAVGTPWVALIAAEDHDHATPIASHAAITGAHHSQSHVLDGADHTVSGLTPGHVLTALTATTFGFSAASAGDLADLGDVVITTVADNEVLAYDSGGNWINQTPAEAGLLGLAGGTMAGDIVMDDYAITGISALQSLGSDLYLDAKSGIVGAQNLHLRADDATGLARTRMTIDGDGDISFYEPDGTLSFFWDESDDEWEFSKDVRVDAALDVTGVVTVGGTTNTQYDSRAIELGKGQGSGGYSVIDFHANDSTQSDRQGRILVSESGMYFSTTGTTTPIRFSNAIGVVDGTVGVPAFALSDANNYDTGMYLYGAGDIGFSVGGSVAARFTSGKDLVLYGDAVLFNAATETTSYIQHSTGSDYFRFVNAGSEQFRMTFHATSTNYFDIKGSASSIINKNGGTNLYLRNSNANYDIFIQTHNGDLPKHRVFIDGSADTIKFYTHNQAEVGYFNATQFRFTTDGTSALPSYSWVNQTNSGMYWVESNKRITFTNQGNTICMVASSSFVPATDNTRNLGVSGLRWVDVWAVDTSINSSDEREKKDIQTIDGPTASKLIEAIDPISFVRKERSRTHWGFGAFQIRDALESLNIDPGDQGVWVDPMMEDNPEEPVDENTPKAIRAAELLPVAWREIQTLRARLEEVETKLAELGET